MRKSLFLILPLAALAAACNQTPRAQQQPPKTTFQQSAEDLSLSYDLAAKKQLLVNNQERHLAEMARQEAELQLRAQRASELSQAVERLAAEQKALGEEIRRRTPPPLTRSATADLPAESAPMQVVKPAAQFSWQPTVRVQNYPTIIVGGDSRDENPRAVQMAQVDTVLPRPSSDRGQHPRRARTIKGAGVGGGVGAAAGAVISASRGYGRLQTAINSGYGGAAGAIAGGLISYFTHRGDRDRHR